MPITIQPEPYTFYADLVRVIDGDTIVVNIDLGFDIWRMNEHVRLAYIDTPEVRTKDLEEKARGFESKAYVEKALLGGKMVLQTEEKSGKYGRYVAIVLIPDVDGCYTVSLNQKLLDEGLAILY
jgi:micrococcal nuclease